MGTKLENHLNVVYFPVQTSSICADIRQFFSLRDTETASQAIIVRTPLPLSLAQLCSHGVRGDCRPPVHLKSR